VCIAGLTRGSLDNISEFKINIMTITKQQLIIFKDLIYDKIDQTDDDYYRNLINQLNNQS